MTPPLPPPGPSPPPAGKYDVVVSFKEGNKSITVWLNYDQEAQSPTSGEVSVGRYGGKVSSTPLTREVAVTLGSEKVLHTVTTYERRVDVEAHEATPSQAESDLSSLLSAQTLKDVAQGSSSATAAPQESAGLPPAPATATEERKEPPLRVNVWSARSSGAQSKVQSAFRLVPPHEVQLTRNLLGQIVVQANPNDTVRKLKEAICEIEGVPLEEQRLIFNGVRLSNSSRLESCGIVDGSDIFITRRGGGSVIGDCPGGCSQGCPSR